MTQQTLPPASAPAVVIIVRGGVANWIASDGVQVELIDFDNLEAGDLVPELGLAEQALIDDSLRAELEQYAPYAVCDHCRTEVTAEAHKAANGDCSLGKCPKCGGTLHRHWLGGN